MAIPQPCAVTVGRVGGSVRASAPRDVVPSPTFDLAPMQHPHTCLVAAAAAALGAAACAGGAGPGAGPGSAVELRAEALPTAARAGDTVRLLAVLTNPTAQRVDLNLGCGPPVLFEVTTPAGAPVYPVPLDAGFECPLLDEHEIEPWETDTVAVAWRAPAAGGRYAVRAGFRAGGRLVGLTAPVRVQVEP